MAANESQNIQITGAAIGSGPQANLLTVTVAAPGDFSTYTLRLVDGLPGSSQPPTGFDPVLSAIDFSFKVACPNDFDCRAVHVCPPSPVVTPDIDYLAKDYASFRQLMLDRISVLSPSWQEQNPADIGIVLVELLAYTGDYLSYQQDAVATEAYLGTARRRVSVRRHARLVDYRVKDGANARVWVDVQVNNDTIQAHPNDPSPLPTGTRIVTLIPARSHSSPQMPRDSSSYSTRRWPFSRLWLPLPQDSTSRTIKSNFTPGARWNVASRMARRARLSRVRFLT